MAGNEDAFVFSVASMIEEILLEYGEELCDVSLTSNAKIAIKRNEATRWLRKSVGVVAAKDLPAEPSEEDFRMGLRSGIILCTVLNKIEPGAIPKVVEAPFDSVIIPDGAPLSTCPYFENILNFLSGVEERKLPTFEASDLEQGGRLSRIVNCVLALKAYSEWKKAGGIGKFRYVGNLKPSSKRKEMVRKSLDLDNCDDLWKDDQDKPLHMRVRNLLSNQKPQDIPVIVEIVLSKLTEEFERRLETHKEKIVEIVATKDNELQANKSQPRARKDTNNEMGSKARSKFKKELLKRVINNEKEENAISEETKSFSDIINEMRKKANADNEMEKKTTTYAKKFASNIKNEMENKTPTYTKKFSSDINNEMEKEVTPDTNMSVSDINNGMGKKETIDATKSISDMNNEMEKKPTTDAKKFTSDVNKEMEEKAVKDDISKEMEKKETIDTTEFTEQEAMIDTTKSSSDINDEMEKKATSDTEKSSSGSDDEMEMEMKKERELREMEMKKERERKEMEKKIERERKEMERKIEREKKEMEKKSEKEKREIERRMEREKQEMERKIEREKKEMERKMKMESKRELETKKEMEKKIESERRAAEDAKEDKYYSWVNAECERLKASETRQNTLVKHQHKELQALKTTFSTAKADMQLLQTNYVKEVNNLGKQLLSLAQAAAGYRKVLDENRKLYNQVQDLKGNIRVYCRSRPWTGKSKPGSVDCIDETTMEVIIPPPKGGKETRKSFTFNRVFDSRATQALVYADTQPLIRSVLDGYNVCIFAYGQTGSGKTFTMTGPDNLTPETMGVNYRALNDLFDIQKQRKNMIAYDVCVQMLEIYNETVRDLLSTDGSGKKLDIRLGAANGINVPDATLVAVSTTEDVIRLMDIGHGNRAVGSTAMNDRSSRSHSCLTVHVNGKDLTSGSTVRGCMHLVDLAGSERADKTEATGDRLKEATHINKSLSALGDVIASLSQKNAHVPYRNSKLTLLLQDALGGQAKTLMFIHVRSDPDTVGETISTLKFAERVSTVELGAAKSNNDVSDLKDLKEQVAFLKAALAKEGGDTQNRNIEKEELVDDEYDDREGAAGESVEADSQLQAKVGNGVAKLKKPSPAQAKSPQSKSSPATPSRKPAAGGNSPATKTAKPSAADSKKRIGK